ncbi:hypothetical protein [Microbacterium sp. MYb62]|uniref:hypothetical protein n=1 Tax=Microbacterium sp. MYb62 TaxID=1848690 RepID=UPI000CFB2E3D|nr:hypothetical protein [Microbacterium sp. MYb62]PRB18850.1 hypothetical protein CQ042_00060 [Microbacterium sp. MYb62]
MDLAILIVNFALLVATGAATVVAFVQARSSLADSREAKSARDEAVAAQRRSTELLDEANAIARSARDTMEERLDLERRRHALHSERRDVSWGGEWPMDICNDQAPTLRMSNLGSTDAYDAVLKVLTPDGDATFHLGDVPAGADADAILEDTEMRGPVAQAVMRRHPTFGSISWQSAAGHREERPIELLAES